MFFSLLSRQKHVLLGQRKGVAGEIQDTLIISAMQEGHMKNRRTEDFRGMEKDRTLERLHEAVFSSWIRAPSSRYAAYCIHSKGCFYAMIVDFKEKTTIMAKISRPDFGRRILYTNYFYRALAEMKALKDI